MRCLVLLCAFLALALDLTTACNPATWTPAQKAMYRCFRRNRWTNPQLRAWYDRVLNPATRPACAQLYVFSEASACMSRQDFASYGVYECTTTTPRPTTPYVAPTTRPTTPPTTPPTIPTTTPAMTPNTPSPFGLPPGPPGGGSGSGAGAGGSGSGAGTGGSGSGAGTGGTGSGAGAGGVGGLPPYGNQLSGVGLPPGPG